MAVITIPYDYDEKTHRHVVPICIADVDNEGKPVVRAWIDRGVAPVAGAFIRIAERLLEDKYRASEIAEYAVHSLSSIRGDNLGDRPSVLVRNRARLYAVDQRVGGRRPRVFRDVEMYTETMESLAENFDFAQHYEHVQIIEKISEQLEILGLHHVREMVPLLLLDVNGSGLAERYGEKANTLRKRFLRGIRAAAAEAGIIWTPGSRG